MIDLYIYIYYILSQNYIPQVSQLHLPSCLLHGASVGGVAAWRIPCREKGYTRDIRPRQFLGCFMCDWKRYDILWSPWWTSLSFASAIARSSLLPFWEVSKASKLGFMVYHIFFLVCRGFPSKPPTNPGSSRSRSPGPSGTDHRQSRHHCTPAVCVRKRPTCSPNPSLDSGTSSLLAAGLGWLWHGIGDLELRQSWDWHIIHITMQFGFLLLLH